MMSYSIVGEHAMQNTKLGIDPRVHALGDKIIGWRRILHQNPELGFEEHETAALILKALEPCAMEIQSGLGGTGVKATLVGGRPGPCLMFRADMDALPLEETGSMAYRSRKDGVKHACGHDGHVAMLLGAARILSECRADLAGRIVFLFQPAEEGGGGARSMIEASALEGVDFAFGAHLWNYQPLGEVGVMEGPTLASADKFQALVKGKASHGAAPHHSVDAILAASHLVVAWQTIISRHINPLESAVITVGQFHGGTAFNIISDEVKLSGTTRAYSEANRCLVKERMQEMARGIGRTMGAEIQFQYEDGYPPTINHPEATQRVIRAAETIQGARITTPYLTMGGEDFAFYGQQVPACFFFLGSSPTILPDQLVPHHCGHFDLDERALLVGTTLWLQLAQTNEAV